MGRGKIAGRTADLLMSFIVGVVLKCVLLIIMLNVWAKPGLWLSLFCEDLIQLPTALPECASLTSVDSIW